MLRAIPLLLALSAAAADAPSVALLVNEAQVDAAKLGEAIASPDALTRATAARVAMVRDVDSLVPQLRTALAAETDANAAREQVRALVLLGNDDDIAFVVSHLSKFPASMDAAFIEAAGRLGAPRGIDVYLRHAESLRDKAPVLHLALWGHPSQLNVTAARFLGAKSVDGFRALLRTALDSTYYVDDGVILAALAAGSEEIRSAALWYVIERYAADPAVIPAPVRERALAERETATPEELFARDVIARMGGAEPVRRESTLVWLRPPAARARRPQLEQIERYLTPDERKALRGGDTAKDLPPAPTGISFAVRQPSFTLPLMLPTGLTKPLLEATRCRDGWVGLVEATVDRAGRVQSVRTAQITTPRGCMTALQTMMRLSLAQPSSITAPLKAPDLIAVKAAGDDSCIDEQPVGDLALGAVRTGGGVKTPEVIHREYPMLPAAVRRTMPSSAPLVVTLEALITRTGCIRDIRILSQSQWPELNAAAVSALSKWKFKPGTLDGRPVDVIFNVSIAFRR